MVRDGAGLDSCFGHHRYLENTRPLVACYSSYNGSLSDYSSNFHVGLGHLDGPVKSKRAIKHRLKELDKLADKFIDERCYTIVNAIQDQIDVLTWCLETAKRRKKRGKP
jgi:hypothetical protein